MGLKEYCVSSKLTISQNDDYHLFEEAFNNSFVYLQLLGRKLVEKRL